MRLYDRYLYHVCGFSESISQSMERNPYVYYERQADTIPKEPLKRGHQRLLGSG